MAEGDSNKKRGSPHNIQDYSAATRFKKGDPRAVAAARKSVQKRKENEALRTVVSKILYAKPKMSESMLEKLKEQMGVDIQDESMLTNASILLFRLMQNANSGDMAAIRQLFEMAGEPTDSRGFIDRERLEIERERLKIERERLQLLKERDVAAENEVPTVIIRRHEGDEE